MNKKDIAKLKTCNIKITKFKTKELDEVEVRASLFIHMVQGPDRKQAVMYGRFVKITKAFFSSETYLHFTDSSGEEQKVRMSKIVEVSKITADFVARKKIKKGGKKKATEKPSKKKVVKKKSTGKRRSKK